MKEIYSVRLFVNGELKHSYSEMTKIHALKMALDFMQHENHMAEVYLLGRTWIRIL